MDRSIESLGQAFTFVTHCFGRAPVVAAHGGHDGLAGLGDRRNWIDHGPIERFVRRGSRPLIAVEECRREVQRGGRRCRGRREGAQ